MEQTSIDKKIGKTDKKIDKKIDISINRRELLKKSAMLGSIFAVGVNFIAAADAAWALEVKYLKPSSMATLVQIARDIYPHDAVGDEYYVVAMKAYDTPDKAPMIESFISEVNRVANKKYLDIGWEIDRVKILRALEKNPTFQAIRAGMVTGLYNQKKLWQIFGYQGESFSRGGYLYRGFDDISWL